MTSTLPPISRGVLSLFTLVVALGGCSGTIPAPHTPPSQPITSFAQERAENLDAQATAINTTGTVLLMLGTTGAIAGSAVLVENSGKGEPDGWKAELTASIGAMAVGAVLRLLGAGMRDRADQARHYAAERKQLDEEQQQQCVEKKQPTPNPEGPRRLSGR